MIVVMLVGAWFLIHQHCCFADAGSPRSIMMDPLMRRSPLEKNFIRFGRSWPHTPSHEPIRIPQSHDNSEVEPNIRPDSNSWIIGPRDARGKENFIRFGRTIGSPAGLRTRDEEANRDPVLPQDANHNGLMIPANDLDLLSSKLHPKFRYDDAMFPRLSRSKQNFIRFGRSNSMLNKNKKYSGHNKDNFIRFGRKDSDDDKFDPNPLQTVTDNEYVDGLRETREKDKGGKSSGFIRFVKSSDHINFSDDRREKRSLSTANGETRCYNSLGSCKSCFLENSLDPTALVAPEFSLLPKIPFQHTPIKNNFIRLG